jgi:hypothetical protein
MKLSPLQKAILKKLAEQRASDDSRKDGHFLIRELVRAYYGPLSREKQAKKYQSAFAATSRALVRLESLGLIARYSPQIIAEEWFALLPDGRNAVTQRDGRS